MGGFVLYNAGVETDPVALFRHIGESGSIQPPPDFKGDWTFNSARQYFSTSQAGWVDPALVEWKAAAATGPGQPAEISSPNLKLQFAANGKPASFQVGGREILYLNNPGEGFVLNSFDFAKGKSISFPLTHLTRSGNNLIVSNGGRVKIIFEISAGDSYVAFQMKELEGIPPESPVWLHFNMNAAAKLNVLPLDYMCGATSYGNSIQVRWTWFGEKSSGNPLGGFAVYPGASDAAEDETLLQIWANEGLPHPKVSGEWNVRAARQWLADWQTQFSDQSQMLISATTNSELYALADYATKMDIKRIYMHTDTWRGEYWPVKFGFLHLNPNTFPQGEADFQKFARYAKSKNIGLTIHTVSCSIANADPDYVVGKTDPRLAKWISGTLDGPVTEADMTLHFRPAPGSEMPLHIDRAVTGSAHVDPWNNINTLRIGQEFIEVGQFTDTDKAVWTLKNCRRGFLQSTPVAHADQASVTGLIRPYGQVFTADNDSTLVEELGKRMAEFVNRNNIIHCEQDAGEIHTVNHQWGYAKFAQAVYTHLDHPVTSNNSGGAPMPCQLEYKFHSSKTAIAARNQPGVPLTIARNGRPATGPYEMFSLLAKPVASGVNSVGIYKPEPMFGVSAEILSQHGLAAYAANTVLAWKKIAPLLNKTQRKTILASSDRVIYRAARVGSKPMLEPIQMLYRTNIDIGWKPGSEFGPVVPRQYFKTGEELVVRNPYAAQEPEFVLRVMNGFDEKSDAPPAALLKQPRDATPEKTLIDAYNIGAGLKPGVSSASGPASPPSNELPLKAARIRNVGDHKFTENGDALRIQFENKRNEMIVNEDNLPEFDCAADMSAACGIGLTVTGDGSGAVLVLQAFMQGMRDYVVPLDFKGARECVIPCGEAAWADARWGWYMRTKGTRYGRLSRLAIGLGKIPAQTTVDIQVSHIRVLSERATALKNPVLTMGAGSLQIIGAIPSESYVWYQGGDHVGVYDLNWNKTAELPVKKQNFIAPAGSLKLSVQCPEANPTPWLEGQFFVKDQPMMIE